MNGKTRNAVIDAAELLIKAIMDRHKITSIEEFYDPNVKELARAVFANVRRETKEFIEYMEIRT